MSKRRGPDDRKRLDPDDVLGGRVKVGVVELLDLIHRVNPTGRELPSREAEQRYAQKSRLQSLLVRRFGPDLEVVADAASEGTVSILHRGHGRDGCHAVLDALDEDARAWVRLQLDLGPASSDAPPPVPAARPSGRRLPPVDEEPVPSSSEPVPSSTGASPESLVRRADDAVASYDFERARGNLERAVAASGGAAGPAEALLALLVETLGDDAAAMALQPSLSRAALADPGVRALLSLAVARAGDPAEAVALLRGADEPRTAEVHAALAARAVSAGSAERAAAHLADLRKRSPAHPAILGLADEIARLRAAARGPFEAELTALVAAGHEGEAERKAAELLAQWPESEAARRVVRAAASLRRLAQEAAEQRAREVEAAAQARQEALLVERVRELLAAPDPKEGLLAWLDLDPALRKRVGEPTAAGAPILKPATADLCRWLDLTPARVAPLARVEAVLAVAVARQRLSGDPEGALEALAAHDAALERVPEARRIAHEAHAELLARRAARAREEALSARRELAAGDAAAALARLEAPVLRDLGDEERAEAEALRAEAAGILIDHKRVAEVGRLRRTGHLFEARELADELLAEAPPGDPEERARWAGERRAIQEEIQRAFRVEIDREPVPLDAEPRADATQTMMEAPVWLTGDGRTLVLAEARRDRVWIQLVDVATCAVRAQMVLRTPETVESVVFHVHGSTAWLSCARGALLAVEVESFTVELFRPGREILPPGHRLGGVAIAADRGAQPRYYWAQPADKDGYACPVQVIDLAARRMVREVPDVHRLAAIPGTAEALVGSFKPAGLVLHEDRGVPVPGGRFPRQDVAMVHATVHPSREGLDGLVVAGPFSRMPWQVERHPGPGSGRKPSPPKPVATERHPACLLDLAAGPARAPWIIADPSGDGTLLGLASSRDTGLVSAVYANPTMDWDLLVLRPTGGTFELLHRSKVPAFTAVVRDADARRLLLYSERPLFLVPLGPQAPDVPLDPKRPTPWTVDVNGAPACLGSAGIRAEMYRHICALSDTQTPDATTATSRLLQREGSIDLLVERTRALVGRGQADELEVQRLREWLWDRHPEHPRVRLLRADDLARTKRWDEVRAVLAPVTPASFADDEDHAQHLCHLLALAALHLGDAGDTGGAARHLADASQHQGSCQLNGLAALLHPRPGPLVPVPAEGQEAEPPPLLTQLVWAVHTADALLQAGDPEGALAALDPKRFDVFDDVQVLARRASAWLALLSPPEGRRRFAMIMTLSRFVQAHAGEFDGVREELPVPGATWDRGRLDEVAGRAVAWLDAQGGG